MINIKLKALAQRTTVKRYFRSIEQLQGLPVVSYAVGSAEWRCAACWAEAGTGPR